MRIVGFNGNNLLEQTRSSEKFHDHKRFVKNLRKKIATGLMAGFIALASPMTQKAHALSWDAVLDAVGAAVGGASAKGQNDTQRGAAASAGVLVVEILKAGVKGKPPTQQEKIDATGRAVAAGLGAMTASKHSSKEEVAFRSAAGVLIYEGAKDAYRYIKQQQVRQNQGTYQNYQGPGPEGQTYCHKVLVRVVENGRLVQERVEERCEARKNEPGYLETPYYYQPAPNQEPGKALSNTKTPKRNRTRWTKFAM